LYKLTMCDSDIDLSRDARTKRIKSARHKRTQTERLRMMMTTQRRCPAPGLPRIEPTIVISESGFHSLTSSICAFLCIKGNNYDKMLHGNEVPRSNTGLRNDSEDRPTDA
jgi:hypothetical protein